MNMTDAPTAYRRISVVFLNDFHMATHKYNPVSPHTRSGIVSLCVCMCKQQSFTAYFCTLFNWYHVRAGMVQSIYNWAAWWTNRAGIYFCLRCRVHADCGAHPSAYSVGIGGSLSRGWARRPGRETDHSSPSCPGARSVWSLTRSLHTSLRRAFS
jgi:hypothetical protein